MADDFDPDSLQTAPPPSAASMKVRPQADQLTRGDAARLVRKYNPDITDAAVQGEVDNIMRESGGKPAVPGDYEGGKATSGGLYQDHNTRLTALKDFAAKEGKPWTDPEIQVRYARLEKERDYPSLLKLQQTTDDRSIAEDSFKRIFERPASVLWGNSAQGKPLFSDYAQREHDGRPNTDVLMMEPQEYLDLAPDLGGKPFESPSGRSLMKSFNRGEQVEAIPTLDVNVDGPTATVTDQDGRHRALLAQQQGVEAIPVAVRKTGEGDPKEIVGLSGKMMAHDFPKAAEYQPSQSSSAPKPGVSLFGQAQAAEPARDQAGNAVDDDPYAQFVTPAKQPEAAPAQPRTAAQGQPAASVQAPATDDPYGGDDPYAQFVAPQKPIPEMSQQEAQAADLNPQQQREWINAQHANFAPNQIANAVGDVVAPIARGVAPYAAGAAAGAALGGPPGALIGAGAVQLGQMATGIGNSLGIPMQTPQNVTDAALTSLGVPQTTTAPQRIMEQSASGAANALSGAGMAGALAKYMVNPAAKAVAGMLAQNHLMQAVSGATGGAGAQIAAELGLGPAWQQLIGLLAAAAPGAKNALAPDLLRENVSPQAEAAIKAGFSLPPAEASVDHIGRFNLTNLFAGEAGKIKTQQLASAKNQPVVNQKAAVELGLPKDTDLGKPGVFESVHQRAGQVKQQIIAAIPEVTLADDPQYVADIQEIGNKYGAATESTERGFPSTATPPGVKNIKTEALKHGRYGTTETMNYLADLRKQANDNITNGSRQADAMKVREGLAQREAAQAVEAAIERSVENAPRYLRERVAEARSKLDNLMRERGSDDLDAGYPREEYPQRQVPMQGRAVEAAERELQTWSDRLAAANARDQNNQTLLDRYRAARQLHAKAYDIEAVTNKSNGNVSATGLARLYNRGKPLTGGLKEIADAANNFRKAFQNPAAFGGVEPLSVLDTAFGLGQAAAAIATHGASKIGHIAAGLAPVSRPWVRNQVLSRPWQNAMIAGPQPRTILPSALTTPLLPTQPTGNALRDTNQGGVQ